MKKPDNHYNPARRCSGFVQFLSILAVALLVLSSTTGRAQYYGGPYGTMDTAGTIYRMDTTYVTFYADTTDYDSTAVFHWYFDDGTAMQTGRIVQHPFTGNVTYEPFSINEIVVSTSSGVIDTGYFVAYWPSVFNCAYIAGVSLYGYPGPVTQPDLSDPGSILISVAFDNVTYPMNLTDHFELNWGNGRVVDTTLPSAAAGSLQVGGYGVTGTDSSQSSLYMYGGQYLITTSAYYSFGSLTCPSVTLHPISIWAAGPPSAPVFTGRTAYCAGDTIRLSVSDTTAQFRHLSHTADTSHTGATGVFNPVYGAVNDSFNCQWFDPSGTLLSQDSNLIIPNINVTDTGIYYMLRACPGLNPSYAYFPLHISVSGVLLQIDSFVNPGCSLNNGIIYLNTHLPNDTEIIHYQFNGGDSVFTGVTNASGLLSMRSLPAGVYSHLQVFRRAGGCGSNMWNSILLTPISLPNVPDSFVNVCTGSPVTLHANSSITGAGYSWVGPHGFSSTLENPTISSVTSSGYYGVTISSGTCVSSTPVWQYVNVQTAVPPAPGPISGADSVCPNWTSFSVDSYTPNRYNSTLRDDSAGGIYSVSDTSIARIIYNNTPGAVNLDGRREGVVTLSYTFYNSCGSSAVTKNIYVMRPTVAPVTGPAFICSGDTATFHDDSTGGKWAMHFDIAGHPASPYLIDSLTGKFRTTDSGNYNIYYGKVNLNGCFNYVSATITVGRPGGMEAFVPGIYPGQSMAPTFEYAFGDTGAVHWSIGSSSIATITDAGLATGLAPGTTIATITAGNACGSSTQEVTVNVGDWINTIIAGQIGTIGGQNAPLGADDMPAVQSLVDFYPNDVAFDTAGNLYFTESGSGFDYSTYGIQPAFGKIRKIDRSGNITTIAGGTNLGAGGYSGDGGPAVEARLNGPWGIVCDRAGNIYFCDQGNALVRKIDPSGQISTIAGVYNLSFDVNGYSATGSVDSGDGGPATMAYLGDPTFLTIDSSGNLYVSELSTNRVRKIGTDGIITTVAGNGVAADIGDGGPATLASVATPGGLAIDRFGNLLICSSGKIRSVDRSGTITTIAGTAGGTFYAGVPATSIGQVFTGDIAVDRSGNIFAAGISSFFLPAILKIDTAGFVSVVAASSYVPTQFGSYADNRFSINCPLIFRGVGNNNSFGITTDDSGSVYAALSSAILKAGKPKTYIKATNDTICGGIPVTFTTNSRNIGNTPSYQWFRNGVHVGGDSSAYVCLTPANGDTINCLVYDTSGGIIISRSNIIMMAVQTPPVVSAIAGPSGLCPGYTIALSDSATGGSWTSSDSARAIVFTSGIVSGTDTGLVTITYTILNTCGTARATKVIAITGYAPGAISGASTVSAAATITLRDTTSGGTWSTSNAAIATVSSTGVVTGVAPGVVTISYSVINSCGASLVTHSDSVTGGSSSVASCSIITTIAGDGFDAGLSSGGFAGGYSGDGGSATAAELNSPFGIAMDSAGNIYFSDGSNNRIRKITPGGIITTIAGNGYSAGSGGGYSGDGGPATAAELFSPRGIALDNSGNIFFSDIGNNVVRKISPTGIISTYAGNGRGVFSGDGGPATDAGISIGPGLATDMHGNLYITDEGNNLIRKVNTDGIISTFAGHYVAGGSTSTYSGDGGPATAADMFRPSGVCVDRVGNVYIAEVLGNRIRKVATTGIISTVAGVGAAGRTGDGGPATAATLANPISVCVDNLGNLYTSDNITNCIRKINTSGIISRFAGNDTAGYSGDGGAATNAALYGPAFLVSDAGLNLYFCDDRNNVIRKITAGIPSIAPVSGASSLTAGSTVTFTDTTSGGTWTSSDTAVASVSSTGLVTGVAPGVATISYAVSNRCGISLSIHTDTVIASGCTGSPVAGIISASLISGCSSYSSVLVASGASSGPGIAYQWQTSTDSTTWSNISGATAAYYTASVTASSYYRLVFTCTTTASSVRSAAVRLHLSGLPVVSAISGASAVCAGTTTTLADTSTGGNWSVSLPAVATVSESGLVAGRTLGAVTISYSLSNECGSTIVTHAVAVDSLPRVGAISGPATVCAGHTATLTDSTTGGSWSTAATAVATVHAGIVYGVSGGSAVIFYTLINSCGSSTGMDTIIVRPLPTIAAITGSPAVCTGVTTLLADSTSGGAWTSSNSIIATVNSAGIVAGVATGNVTISYSVTNSCGTTTATHSLSVDSLPHSGSITGADTVCTGAFILFTDTCSGGVWSSANMAVATVTTAGHAWGVAAGNDTIAYTVTNGCGTSVAKKSIYVLPFPMAGTITGVDSLCPGETITLADTVTGGIWTLSDYWVASNSGPTIIGNNAGLETVYYTFTNSCGSQTVEKPLIVRTAESCEAGVATVVNTGNTFSVYPNPNQGSCIVSLTTGSKDPVTLTVTNVLGQKIKTQEILPDTDNEIILNVSAGVYYLSTQVGGQQISRKIVVE